MSFISFSGYFKVFVPYVQPLDPSETISIPDLLALLYLKFSTNTIYLKCLNEFYGTSRPREIYTSY